MLRQGKLLTLAVNEELSLHLKRLEKAEETIRSWEGPINESYPDASIVLVQHPLSRPLTTPVDPDPGRKDAESPS